MKRNVIAIYYVNNTYYGTYKYILNTKQTNQIQNTIKKHKKNTTITIRNEYRKCNK